MDIFEDVVINYPLGKGNTVSRGFKQQINGDLKHADGKACGDMNRGKVQ